MVFLPHTNTVILMEPYCGTMTEPGLPVGIQGIQGIHGYTWVYRVYKVYMVYRVYIENTSWKVLAYGVYARVVDVSEIERVSAANE